MTAPSQPTAQPATSRTQQAMHDEHDSPFSLLSGGIGTRIAIAGGASLLLWLFMAWALT